MENWELDFEEIFNTVTGDQNEAFRVSWVENVWEKETGFQLAYEDFQEARENLCRRFGLDFEDPDLERFMDGVLKLEKDIARRMFLAGITYARKGCRL